jgi:hypothetical protein
VTKALFGEGAPYLGLIKNPYWLLNFFCRHLSQRVDNG